MLSCPQQVLRVLNLVAKRILPDLTDTASDDILNSFLNCHAAADLVNKLVEKAVSALVRNLCTHVRTLSRSLARPPRRSTNDFCADVKAIWMPASSSFCCTNDRALCLSASESVIRFNGWDGSAATVPVLATKNDSARRSSAPLASAFELSRLSLTTTTWAT